MPELPDVEDARHELSRWLTGTTVVELHLSDTRLGRGKRAPPPAMVAGRRVLGVGRRGKWLRIDLGEVLLFSHLGMTGKWTCRSPGAPAERSERAQIVVRRRRARLCVGYVDARRLGRLVVTRDDIPEWRALGPDPLADGIDVPRLIAELGKQRRAVKVALMDQSLLAGIGNVHATEALFFAGVDPRTRTDALSPRQVRAVARGVRRTLARSLARYREARARGGSVYVSEEGADDFLVYGREGEACPRCGGRIERIVLGGRGTTFCPRCQRRS